VAITLVNTDSGAGGGNGGTIASAGAVLTAGNLLVVAVTFASTNVTSIADTAGNTYVAAGTISSANPSANLAEIWYAKNVTGHAANVVTVTFNGTPNLRAIHVLQYAGVHTTALVDASAEGTGSGTWNGLTSSFSPTQPGNLNVASFSDNNGATTWTAGTGYTKELEVKGGGGDDFLTEDKLSAAAGAQTAAGNASSGNAGNSKAGSWKDASFAYPSFRLASRRPAAFSPGIAR